MLFKVLSWTDWSCQSCSLDFNRSFLSSSMVTYLLIVYSLCVSAHSTFALLRRFAAPSSLKISIASKLVWVASTELLLFRTCCIDSSYHYHLEGKLDDCYAGLLFYHTHSGWCLDWYYVLMKAFASLIASGINLASLQLWGRSSMNPQSDLFFLVMRR